MRNVGAISAHRCALVAQFWCNCGAFWHNYWCNFGATLTQFCAIIGATLRNFAQLLASFYERILSAADAQASAQWCRLRLQQRSDRSSSREVRSQTPSLSKMHPALAMKWFWVRLASCTGTSSLPAAPRDVALDHGVLDLVHAAFMPDLVTTSDGTQCSLASTQRMSDLD